MTPAEAMQHPYIVGDSKPKMHSPTMRLETDGHIVAEETHRHLEKNLPRISHA